jgi:hypothetical protein
MKENISLIVFHDAGGFSSFCWNLAVKKRLYQPVNPCMCEAFFITTLQRHNALYR